jgi:hypothetical protein
MVLHVAISSDCKYIHSKDFLRKTASYWEVSSGSPLDKKQTSFPSMEDQYPISANTLGRVYMVDADNGVGYTQDSFSGIFQTKLPLVIIKRDRAYEHWTFKESECRG